MYCNRGMVERFSQIDIVSEDRCKPKKFRKECKKSCHFVKTGRLCNEVTCRLLVPRPGQVLGFIGTNFIGKSTALKILAGKLQPNIDRYNNPPVWQEIHLFGRIHQSSRIGSELQSYFIRVLEENLKTVIKPQHVDQIKKLVLGNLGKMLEKLGVREKMAQICVYLELDTVLDSRVKDEPGRELQRFTIAAVFIKKAEIYMFDELASFLDVQQRLKAAQVIHSLLGPDSRLLKLGRMTTMSDLPEDLLEEILSRVPSTSLSAVRSTCKKWNALSKNSIFGKKATAVRKQFLGFIMMDYRVCSMKFDLQGIPNDTDFVDPSIKQVDILNQVEISKVFHCDGLLLCITKDNSRLVVWNPYLGQTRWIQPRDSIHMSDMYALGYDNNRNHKILRIFGDPKRIYHDFGYETYNFSSNSWKVYNATPLWDLKCHQRGVSLNGNTYFLANQKRDSKDIVVCFDFTTERFGPRLPLPYHFRGQECFESLACVREEKLAVLHQSWGIEEVTEIWVANKIDPGAVSWSKFLRSTSGCKAHIFGGSFFIDEEKKVAVILDLDVFMPTGRRCCNQTAHIIGQDGYFKPVNIGKAPNLGEFDKFGIYHPNFCRPLVCSSYVPSLVQLQSNEASIREESDD